MNKQRVIFAACSEYREDAVTRGVWFQTFPAYGRYPVGGIIKDAAADAEFVFDEAAARDVLRNFRTEVGRDGSPGVLVDREHFSCDRGKPSDALAWAKDIRQEADGSIWTRWEFTPQGRELWETKTLVNRSPAFACTRDGRDYRPFRLESIAMTNTPHFKELSTLAAARAAEVNNTKGEIRMNKIMEALGLGEGTSEDEAVAAINALKERASAAEVKATDAEKAKDDAEKRCGEAEAECRALRADAFIAANRERITDEAKARAAYMKAPEATEAAFALCKGAAGGNGQQQVLAKAKATPAKPSDVQAGLAACKSAEERVAYVTAHAAEFAAEEK